MQICTLMQSCAAPTVGLKVMKARRICVHLCVLMWCLHLCSWQSEMRLFFIAFVLLQLLKHSVWSGLMVLLYALQTQQHCLHGCKPDINPQSHHPSPDLHTHITTYIQKPLLSISWFSLSLPLTMLSQVKHGNVPLLTTPLLWGQKREFKNKLRRRQ